MININFNYLEYLLSLININADLYKDNNKLETIKNNINTFDIKFENIFITNDYLFVSKSKNINTLLISNITTESFTDIENKESKMIDSKYVIPKVKHSLIEKIDNNEQNEEPVITGFIYTAINNALMLYLINKDHLDDNVGYLFIKQNENNYNLLEKADIFLKHEFTNDLNYENKIQNIIEINTTGTTTSYYEDIKLKTTVHDKYNILKLNNTETLNKLIENKDYITYYHNLNTFIKKKYNLLKFSIISFLNPKYNLKPQIGFISWLKDNRVINIKKNSISILINTLLEYLKTTNY